MHASSLLENAQLSFESSHAKTEPNSVVAVGITKGSLNNTSSSLRVMFNNVN